MKKYSYTSLRQFSWSGKKEKTKSEILIENTVLEWYDAKHRQTSLDEIAFINSIKIISCPYCNGAVNKIGHREDGIQRYICKECHRKFNPLTGTIFDSHKIPIQNGLNTLLIYSNFIQSRLVQPIIEIAKQQENIGSIRFFSC